MRLRNGRHRGRLLLRRLHLEDLRVPVVGVISWRQTRGQRRGIVAAQRRGFVFEHVLGHVADFVGQHVLLHVALQRKDIFWL